MWRRVFSSSCRGAGAPLVAGNEFRLLTPTHRLRAESRCSLDGGARRLVRGANIGLGLNGEERKKWCAVVAGNEFRLLTPTHRLRAESRCSLDGCEMKMKRS
jgi:hypothetical protein